MTRRHQGLCEASGQDFSNQRRLGEVMAALTIIAVVIAMASLSPSLALCEEEQQREASTHCVCKQTKGSSSSNHGVHTFPPLGFQGLGF
ncbi:unnamed protein product [Sphagnum jensenii]|uniref:Uncharacterized protein n=1 Tax=Sphagnum jensenii TaxID=128206 RepID=A0ABP0WGV2_9BRYO